MKLLYEFDDGNYNESMPKITREAVRAVIFKDGNLVMVYSKKENFYKFPGGGIENSETHTEALAREVSEETGLKLLPDSIREFGMIREIRKDVVCNDKIFEQISYYYFAETEEEAGNQNLTENERNLEYVLTFVDIDTALKVNIESEKLNRRSFLLREAKTLEILLEQSK